MTLTVFQSISAQTLLFLKLAAATAMGNLVGLHVCRAAIIHVVQFIMLAGEGARSRDLPIWPAAQQLQDGGGEQQTHAQLVQLAHCCWCH